MGHPTNMNIREYTSADLPAMSAIWNAVVEKDFLGSEP